MVTIEQMRKVSGETRAIAKRNPSRRASIMRCKCLDCVAYQPAEVRKCVAYACFLWPHRMGKLDRVDLAKHLAELDTTPLV